MRSTVDHTVIDNIIITTDDTLLITRILSVFNNLDLLDVSKIPQVNLTMGQWAARIWRAISDANNDILGEFVQLDADTRVPRFIK